jgi:hypothetical protein
MKSESELGASGTRDMLLAFPAPANKWRTKPAKLTFGSGFLDRLEVVGETIPYSNGQYGMTVSFCYLEAMSTRDGRTIGDIGAMRYVDGQLMACEQAAKGVEIIQ